MPYKDPNYMKEYYKNNKDKMKQHRATYRNTPAGIKAGLINMWRHRGLIETDQYTFDELYEAYLCCSECEECGVTLTIGKRCKTTKCLDHDHTTGIFRNILCQSCNVKRR